MFESLLEGIVVAPLGGTSGPSPQRACAVFRSTVSSPSEELRRIFSKRLRLPFCECGDCDTFLSEGLTHLLSEGSRSISSQRDPYTPLRETVDGSSIVA